MAASLVAGAGPSMYEDFTQIHVAISDGICTISLNRPRLRNAFSRIMTYEVDRSFQAACNDPLVRVIILRGEGDHFCSGHDLGSESHIADLQSNSYENMGYPGPSGDYKKWSDLDVEMCLRWRQLSKPLLCGIKGYTIYHGCAVMSCADIVIAAEDSRIMPSLVEYSALSWDLALNTRKAKEIMMLQRFILAEEAEELGLVNRVVPVAQLDAELRAMALAIGKADHFHLRMMKLTANQAQDSAGMTQHVRSSLSNWTAYRWNWTEEGNRAGDGAKLMADHGGNTKRLAPVADALARDVMYWSETAAVAAKARRRGMQAKL